MAEANKLIFLSVVEPLLEVARRGGVDLKTQRELAALRMPLGGKLEPAYPAETWAQAVRLIGSSLFADQKPDEQHRRVGRRTIGQFIDTFVGKALMTAARMWGPRRSL